MTVGDAGNAPDTAVMGDGTTGYGSVPYTYRMGTYDVTLGQYVAFLNSVATKSDPYGLYNSGMAPGARMPTIGIVQSGNSGSYSYTVGGSYSQAANCPIYDVTWGDAARFCNWLDNDQPTSGTEAAGTTETGAYTLNGATSNALLYTTTRNAGTTYFIPSEDEWYKAAYYSGGGTTAAYYTYATKSNLAPNNSLVLAPTSTNDANYNEGGNVTDPTNCLTPVGTFAASPGPYGTYDMGGDVFQWNEAQISGSWRGLRGGSWLDGLSGSLTSSFRSDTFPTNAYSDSGFRVASSVAVPEPGSLALLLAGAVGLLAFAWRKRKHSAASEAPAILSMPSPWTQSARKAA